MIGEDRTVVDVVEGTVFEKKLNSQRLKILVEFAQLPQHVHFRHTSRTVCIGNEVKFDRDILYCPAFGRYRRQCCLIGLQAAQHKRVGFCSVCSAPRGMLTFLAVEGSERG